MDLDAAWTDAVLAMVAWGVGVAAVARGTVHRRIAGGGASLVALAATVGAIRLSAVPELQRLHEGLTAVAGALGVPLLALGTALHLVRADRRWILAAIPVVGGLPFAGIEAYRVGASS